MSGIEAVKAEIGKLSAQAAFDVFARLEAKRAELKTLQTA